MRFQEQLMQFLPQLAPIAGIFGAIGGAVAAAFGGWSAALTTLLLCMMLDYISGIIVAGVFKNSRKSEGGALSSRAGWQGLCRKAMTLLMVLIAARLDLLLGTAFLREALIIAYTLNELLSIMENAGLMGVPLPAVLQDAIELLRKKADLTAKEVLK